jgi:hypothetical protein
MAELAEPPALVNDDVEVEIKTEEPVKKKKPRLPAARIRRSRAELEALIEAKKRRTEESQKAIEKHVEETRAAPGVGELPAAVREEKKEAEERPAPAKKPRAQLRPAELRGALDAFIESKQPGYRWKMAGAAALAAGAVVYTKAPDIVMALGSSGLF